MKNWLSPIMWVLLGLVIGAALAAQSFERWERAQVVPIVLVRPSLGSFVPEQGSSIDASWSKSEVVPMCQVKLVIGGSLRLPMPESTT